MTATNMPDIDDESTENATTTLMGSIAGPDDELPTSYHVLDLARSKTAGKPLSYIPLKDQHISNVKFYPYSPPTAAPVFALVGGTHTIVCRVVLDKPDGYEILQWIATGQDNRHHIDNLNSLAWSRDPRTGNPIVCVAGSRSDLDASIVDEGAAIRVLDVITGKLVKELVGHGAAVNDLVVHESTPSMLASCSEDHTIRIWDLHSKEDSNSCVAICAGDSQRQGLISIAYHASSRYLLSGGFNGSVNMWAIPRFPLSNARTDNITLVHFPMFSSVEIHGDYIDCVEFYGDCILSKCRDGGHILLWRINGFNGQIRPADEFKGPAKLVGDHDETRSAFGNGFQQLLSFDISGCSQYRMRFSLFHQPFRHPVLAIGNNRAEVLFWDLHNLEKGILGPYDWFDTRRSPLDPSGKGKAKVTMIQGSLTASAMLERKLPAPCISFGGPFKEHIPHVTQQIQLHRGSRISYDDHAFMQSAWSKSGEYCVFIGKSDTVVICRKPVYNV